VCVCVCVCVRAQAVVHVYVPELFPDEAPTLMLQSVVHLIDRVPLVHTPPAMAYAALPPLLFFPPFTRLAHGQGV
jgi:hypothetical protein